jgi:hypothetical protein
MCVESGDATVTVTVSTIQSTDIASMLVICENGVEAEGDEPSSETESEDDVIANLPDCEKFDSDINVGSINQVANAANATGLIPEDVKPRPVGQELRRMMEVTGEVCQSDLLALVTEGTLSPELENAIKIAVERVGQND